MTHYYAYDTNSTVTVTESFTIKNAQITLRHIPKPDSISINGFTETTSLSPAKGQFFCDYSPDTQFRDSSRVLHFNAADNNKSVTVNYVAIGTVFTADDANEIKAHLENSSIHGGGGSIQLGNGATFTDENVQGGEYSLNNSGLTLDDGQLNSTAFYRVRHDENVNYIDPTNWNYGAVDLQPGDVYLDFNGEPPKFFIVEGGSLRDIDNPSVRLTERYDTDDCCRGDIFHDSSVGYMLKTAADDAIPIQVPYEDQSTLLQSQVLPPATANARGAIRPGTGLAMNGDVLNCTLSGSGSTFHGRCYGYFPSSNVNAGDICFRSDLDTFYIYINYYGWLPTCNIPKLEQFNCTQLVKYNPNDDMDHGIINCFFLNYATQNHWSLYLPDKFINFNYKFVQNGTTFHYYYDVKLTFTDGTELLVVDGFEDDDFEDFPVLPCYVKSTLYYADDHYSSGIGLSNLDQDNFDQIVVHYTTDALGNIYDFDSSLPYRGSPAYFTFAFTDFPTNALTGTFCFRVDLQKLYLFDGNSWRPV